MDTQTLALTLAYIGSAIGVAVVVPQIQRILANPRMTGVSPWTWGIVAVACSLWINYGLRTGSMPQVPGNTLIIAGAIAIVLLVPVAWSRRGRAALLGAVIGSLFLVGTLLTPEQVGFLAFGVGLLAAWPQVYETVWARRGMGPSAISLTSQAIGIVAQAFWFTFAVLTTDVPVIFGSSMALFTTGLIAAVELHRRRAAAATLPGGSRVLVGSGA